MMNKGVEKKELTKEEILMIPELVKTLKYEEIATKLGVHKNTIRNWVAKLRKAGYKIETVKGRRGILDTLEENNK